MIEFNARDTIVLACLVLFLGKFLNKRIPFLREYNIPEPVTGGLLFSALFGVLYAIFHMPPSFALDLRDALLVIFFTTIGLSSKLNTLRSGGKSLLVLLLLAVGYLFIQNLTGIGAAMLSGLSPVTGLLAGSVSFSGGHGTAIAWTPVFETGFNVSGAAEFGIACATLGLVMGSVVGGPVANFLVKRFDLKPAEDLPVTVGVEYDHDKVQIDYDRALQTIFMIFITAGAGIYLKIVIGWLGLSLPTFVTALFAGILMTNIIPLFNKTIWQPEKSKSLAMASDLSLGLFLAMSLMSLELWTIASFAGPLLIIVGAQVVMIMLYTVFVVFRVMGKDYDAAVMSAGYIGLALGATPTAIANMTAVTQKLGGAPKAFLVVPLVGAFFIDISNALIIKFFLGFFE